MKGWYAVMTEYDMRYSMPNPLETNVIRAFGWSLIEFEMTLYQKFLSLSIEGSLMAFEEFKEILRNMESKGFLQELSFQGKKAFRKLIVDSELQTSAKPSQPNDEMRLAIGGMKARTLEKKTESKRVDAEKLGQKILQSLKDWLLKESGLSQIDVVILRECIEEIRIALSKSEEEFIECLSCEYPGILAEVNEALDSYGSDSLIQGLQKIESDLAHE